jgi:predicted GNAT family acetyltransferase
MNARTLPPVQHDTQQQRFWVEVAGHRCVCDYRLRQGVAALTHTGVPPAVAGQGIAAHLVQAALHWARAEGLKVDPVCSYVAVYLRRHPAEQDLAV